MMQETDRKKMIRQGFDTVAPGYDHPSLSFFPETAKRMVEYLDLQPDQHLLDVCTGTGAIALTAAEMLTRGRVTAVDLSSGMLAQARNKANERRLDNIDFLQMDLDHLDFPPQTFDAACSSFGLFFVEDMVQGLGRIAEKVRDGGKIAISTFSDSAFSPMADLFLSRYEAFGYEVPPLSWRRLSTADLIEANFNAAGILDLNVHHEPLGYRMTEPETWWDIVWNAGWRSLLNRLTEEEREEFRAVHLEEVGALIGPDGVWFNTEVLIAVGRK